MPRLQISRLYPDNDNHQIRTRFLTGVLSEFAGGPAAADQELVAARRRLAEVDDGPVVVNSPLLSRELRGLRYGLSPLEELARAVVPVA